MLQGHQRLLEARHGLSFLPGLAAIGQGLVPHLAPQGMVRQPFHLVGEPVSLALFAGRDNAAMQQALPLA
jgi:hypothetical protein